MKNKRHLLSKLRLDLPEYYDYQPKLRCIYKYEFEYNNEKYIYIGLTHNIRMRDNKHRIDTSSSVYKFAKKHKLEIPKPVIEIDYEEEHKASIDEGLVLEHYLNLGYKKINRAKTGGLGGIFCVYAKCSKEICQKIIKKYKLQYRT